MAPAGRKPGRGTSGAKQIGVTRGVASRIGSQTQAKAADRSNPPTCKQTPASSSTRRPDPGRRRTRCRGPGLAPLGRARGIAWSNGPRNPPHLGLDSVGTEHARRRRQSRPGGRSANPRCYRGRPAFVKIIPSQTITHAAEPFAPGPQVLRPATRESASGLRFAASTPGRIRLVGNVTGQPPHRGTLRRPGWEASRLQLREWSGSENPQALWCRRRCEERRRNDAPTRAAGSSLERFCGSAPVAAADNSVACLGYRPEYSEVFRPENPSMDELPVR